jgi:hypothetical protein
MDCLGFLGDNVQMALGRHAAFKGIPLQGGRLATIRRD